MSATVEAPPATSLRIEDLHVSRGAREVLEGVTIDIAYLDAFMDRSVSAASPVKAIAVLSRSDELFVQRLFEKTIPEIEDKTIKIEKV